MITIDTKDEVLGAIISADSMLFVWDYEEQARFFGLKTCVFEAIMDQFEQMRLIEVTQTKDDALVKVLVNAHDLFRQGGFKAQEEILKQNIKKLSMELEHLAKQLNPGLKDNCRMILELSNVIISSLQLFKYQ